MGKNGYIIYHVIGWTDKTRSADFSKDYKQFTRAKKCYEALAKNGYVMGTLRKDEVLVDTGDTYIAIDEVIKSF